MPDLHSTVPGDLELLTADGERVTTGEVFTAELTVVQLVRYFGCLPCQEWLVGLDRQAGTWRQQGCAVVAIGGSADYQARWLRDERGITVPLFLDPDHAFRERVGAGATLGARLLHPRGAAAYARSLRHGFRPQRITRDTTRSPGVVVVDRSGTVRWQYVGERIGDYPPLAAVKLVILDLLASAR